MEGADKWSKITTGLFLTALITKSSVLKFPPTKILLFPTILIEKLIHQLNHCNINGEPVSYINKKCI